MIEKKKKVVPAPVMQQRCFKCKQLLSTVPAENTTQRIGADCFYVHLGCMENLTPMEAAFVAAQQAEVKNKIAVPTNPESLAQFIALLVIRKANGEISQEEIDREMAAIRQVRGNER